MWKVIYKIIVVAVFLGLILCVLSVAPNYKKSTIEGKLGWVINHSDVTLSTKKDPFQDERGNFYVAMEDIANFFDEQIEYDAKYDHIVTTGYDKVATIPIGSTQIDINGRTEDIQAPVIKKEDTYYIPLKELEAIYVISVEYKEETHTVVVESLDREKKGANTTKKSTVHALPTVFSKSVDKLAKAEEVTIIEK